MKTKRAYDQIDDIILEADRGQIYEKVIGEAEKIIIEKTLKLSFGNRSIAAKLLGINRNTLRFKISKLGIDVEKYRI